MHKYPVLSGKELITIFQKLGFEIQNQKGSHVKITKYVGNEKRIVIIPLKKVIRIGTFKSILRQAKMSIEEFEAKTKI